MEAQLIQQFNFLCLFTYFSGILMEESQIICRNTLEMAKPSQCHHLVAKVTFAPKMVLTILLTLTCTTQVSSLPSTMSTACRGHSFPHQQMHYATCASGATEIRCDSCTQTVSHLNSHFIINTLFTLIVMSIHVYLLKNRILHNDKMI